MQMSKGNRQTGVEGFPLGWFPVRVSLNENLKKRNECFPCSVTMANLTFVIEKK
jgi:hypothetical protein